MGSTGNEDEAIRRAIYVRLFFSSLLSVMSSKRSSMNSVYRVGQSAIGARCVRGEAAPCHWLRWFFPKGRNFSSHLDWIFSPIQGTLIRYLRDLTVFKLRTGTVWKAETPTMRPGRVCVFERRRGGGPAGWRWRCRSWNHRPAKLTASMSASAVVCH